MVIYKPPQRTNRGPEWGKKIFLAGSIEMGVADLWQDKLANILDDSNVVYNPRRDDWDPTWEQNYENPQFYQQVSWELDHLDKADLVIFYFDPATKSPITLIELGLMAAAKKECLVCCPEGYWRKGNVDIICHRYGIQQCDTFEELCRFSRALSIPF